MTEHERIDRLADKLANTTTMGDWSEIIADALAQERKEAGFRAMAKMTELNVKQFMGSTLPFRNLVCEAILNDD